MCRARQTRAIQRGPQIFIKVVEMHLHEFQLAALVALSWSAFPCHSSKLSLFPVLPRGLWVFPLHSWSNPKASCFWPLRFTEGYLIITATNTTLRVARWYKEPTKPSPSPRTFLPDTKINLYFFISKHWLIVHTAVWVEGLSIFFHPLCVCRDWQSRNRRKSTVCVPCREEARRTTDTSDIPVFLKDADWQEHFHHFTWLHTSM